MALDTLDNLYIADSYNHWVLRVTRDGDISVLPGTSNGGLGARQLTFPRTLAVDRAGNVYVADSYNQRVQKLTPEGTVTTIAGGLGQGATEGQLNQPFGTAVDSDGNLYIADTFNHRVQKYTVPATLAAPQLRHAAKNLRSPGSLNLLMRISPALTCQTRSLWPVLRLPVKPGTMVSLYGTGFGVLDTADGLRKRRPACNRCGYSWTATRRKAAW